MSFFITIGDSLWYSEWQAGRIQNVSLQLSGSELLLEIYFVAASRSSPRSEWQAGRIQSVTCPDISGAKDVFLYYYWRFLVILGMTSRADPKRKFTTIRERITIGDLLRSCFAVFTAFRMTSRANPEHYLSRNFGSERSLCILLLEIYS